MSLLFLGLKVSHYGCAPARLCFYSDFIDCCPLHAAGVFLDNKVITGYATTVKVMVFYLFVLIKVLQATLASAIAIAEHALVLRGGRKV